jgi:hypothetical protein
VAGVLEQEGCMPPAAARSRSRPPRRTTARRALPGEGCPQCHSISALGVKSATEVGPDLTLAWRRQNRFNQPLEQFLQPDRNYADRKLSQMIKLSPEERDSVIHILAASRCRHEERGEH